MTFEDAWMSKRDGFTEGWEGEADKEDNQGRDDQQIRSDDGSSLRQIK